MPSYNITIDDVSPVWKFSTGWRANPTSDSAAGEYLNGTFTATAVNGANASLVFNGTAITFYGAKRQNHGSFRANVDGGGSNDIFSTHTDDDTFKSPLFSMNNLDSTQQHILNLVNAPDAGSQDTWFDVDYAIISLGDGNGTTSYNWTKLDDTGSPNITYDTNFVDGPKTQWSPKYSDQTYHLSNVQDSKATISFYGSAIEIYGAVSTNHGNFSVSLDGGSDIMLNGRSWEFMPQTLLYCFSGLADGPHTVVLTHQANNASIFTDLDHVIVYHWGNTSGNDDNKQNVGAIAGGVVAGVVALILLGLLGLWIRRRRRRAQWDNEKDSRGPVLGELMQGSGLLASVAAPASTSPGHQRPRSTDGGVTLLSGDGEHTASSSPNGNALAPPQYDEIINYNQNPDNEIALASSTVSGQADNVQPPSGKRQHVLTWRG